MYPTLGDLLGGWLGPLAPIDTHGFFVGLGLVAAAVVFVAEARRRRLTDDRLAYVVLGALVGGAVFMRMGTWVQHVDLRENASLVEHWMYGNRSILGGLFGAWLGVHVAKRLCGYRMRTGDLFAPAVALGMGVGRLGCHFTELPGTPTSLPWAVTVDGTPRHPSLIYEVIFQLVAFAALWWWLRHRELPPGESFTLYVLSYAIFRFVVEYVRGNEVVWQGFTRPQLVLAVTIPLVVARVAVQARKGTYRGLRTRPVAVVGR